MITLNFSLTSSLTSNKMPFTSLYLLSEELKLLFDLAVGSLLLLGIVRSWGLWMARIGRIGISESRFPPRLRGFSVGCLSSLSIIFYYIISILAKFLYAFLNAFDNLSLMVQHWFFNLIILIFYFNLKSNISIKLLHSRRRPKTGSRLVFQFCHANLFVILEYFCRKGLW